MRGSDFEFCIKFKMLLTSTLLLAFNNFRFAPNTKIFKYYFIFPYSALFLDNVSDVSLHIRVSHIFPSFCLLVVMIDDRKLITRKPTHE